MLEFTDKKLRFYYDDAAVLEASKNITLMTNANPGVFTSASHGFAVGDEIFLAGLSYLDNISGQFYKIDTTPSANTFTLATIAGAVLNTTAVGAYTSGGTASRVYEIATAYEEQDLPFLQYAQSADTMWITHRNYKQRKLVRAGHTSWTIGTFAITGDPFVSTVKNISGITKASPAVVTSNAHGFVNGQLIFVEAVAGMTQVNDRFFVVRNVNTNDFSLETRAGVAVDSSGYTAYTSGGTATTPDKYPRAVALTDAGRLVYGGPVANPATLFFSAAPSSGNTDYDNFTQGGTTATSPITGTLGAVQGKVDIIQWIASTSKFMVVGTFSTLRRVYGAQEQNSVSVTDFNAKPVNSFGCAQVLPTVNGDVLFYAQRAGKKIRSLEYDLSADGYTTIDRNLISKHLTINGVKQLVEQQGDIDLIWAVMYTGELRTLTYKQKEDISGWSKQNIAGRHVNAKGVTKKFAKVISMAAVPRPSGVDRVWMCVERVINGSTVRSIEYLTDPVNFALRDDFYTHDETQDVSRADEELWENAIWENQKDDSHLDSSLFYDGLNTGLAASASVTPASSAIASGVVFTASAAVFTSTALMAGREIWKQYDESGTGGGRARIVSIIDSTHAVCDIIAPFDNTTAIPAGSWYLTTDKLSGLQHLEGETISVLIDGGTHQDVTVANGKIQLLAQGSKIRVGYGFIGLVATLNIDIGGVTGPAAAKKRSVVSLDFRLLNTTSLRFGTNKYRLETMLFRKGGMKGSRPPVPFNGIKTQGFTDAPESANKQVYMVQSKPVNCTILSVNVTADTADEQQP